MARVVLVDYRRIFDLGNYQNERIGVAFEVRDDEEPGWVMDQAVAWVHAEHERLEAARQAVRAEQREVYSAQRQRDTLAYEVRQIERARAELLRHAETLVKILSVHGVDVSDIQQSINIAPVVAEEIANGELEEDGSDFDR